MIDDYYTILGVDRTASDSDIKRAYRNLAVRYHPDKNPDPKAEALFKEINAAYDVLSDPEKKRAYDLRGISQYETSVAPTQRPHRDPRYRPKPPGYRPPPKSDMRGAMRTMLRYMQWINKLAVIITVLFMVDFFLPYHTDVESVADVEAVRGRKNSFLYYKIYTDQGYSFKMYDMKTGHLSRGDQVAIEKTMVYKTPMYVTGRTEIKIRLAHAYKGLFFFPCITLICSALALLYRKQLEFPYNLSIVAFLFLIITLVLIL